jgi:hypothetical protein
LLEVFRIDEQRIRADGGTHSGRDKELRGISKGARNMTREVREAAKYNVLPLNNDTFARALAPPPSATASKTVFTYSGVNSSINSSNAPNILGRSYRITAEVDVPQGGGDGMLVTMSGRWGGYGLYLLKGRPVFDPTCSSSLTTACRTGYAHGGQAYDRVRLHI